MNLGNLNVTLDFQYCWKCRPYSVQVAWEEEWPPYIHFLLTTVLVFYKVTVNTEAANTEAFILEETQC